MEIYKKKSLNFMGYSRELRKTQMETRRDVSRMKRISTIRFLEDESSTEENKVKESRIPPIGKQKDLASSRVEMLQKWKQEKMVKKQQESRLKKPTFKVGVSKPMNSPLASKPLFALDTSSKLFKSSFQMSNSKLYIKKQESLNASNTKTNVKVSQFVKKPDVDKVNTKNNAKDMKIQPSISKLMAPSKPESRLTKNKESGIQSLGLKPKVDTRSRLVQKDQVYSNRKQPTIITKPLLQTKSVESRLPPLNARSKVNSLAKDAKSNIPSSGLPKATVSRTLSTEPKQTIPKKINAVKSIPKFSKTVVSQQKGNLFEKTSISKVPNKPVNDCLTIKPNNEAAFECELSHIEPVKEQRKSFAPAGFKFQPPIELNSSLFLEDGPSAIFLRMKNQFLRTSTPKQSPSSQKSSSETENSDCFQNEVIKFPKDETIYCPKEDTIQCLKDENIQCSKDENIQCPKNDPIQCPKDNPIQCPKDDPIQCPKDNPIQCPKDDPIQSPQDEDVQCSKNVDNKLESSHKYDLEALLSSSLESVYLNDVKPIDCKQSLKFGFSEVEPTLNQDGMFLSSEITHPEHSLALGSIPGGTIYPTIHCPKEDILQCPKDENIQCSKDEEKVDVQCSKNVDNKLESSHKHDLEALLSSSLESVYLNDVKPIDCNQSLKFEFPEVVPTQKQEEVLLPPKITHPEHSLALESIPGGTIYPPILPHSVEIDKTDIISTDTRPTDDNQIIVPFTKVNSVLSEAIPDPKYIVKTIDCKQSPKSATPEFASMQNQDLLSCNTMYPEQSLNEKPTSNGGYPLVLPDSVEKTDFNSTDLEGDNKTSLIILDPTSVEAGENTIKGQSVPNGFLQKKENVFLKNPERKNRNFRQSEKPGLFSINESLENTPQSALKKKMFDSVFTPRRSLRLASKLSGNFCSLENLLDSPKPSEKKDEAGLKNDFTPRRSLRLSKFSTEFNSAENLFDIRRPTLYGTPEEKVVPKIYSRATYDFDRLSSETEEETRPRNTRGGKVSLLYSPSRPSIIRHSIKGDLMSFSPNE